MSETTKAAAPAVSVIIPVYNVEQYLCQCLDSVVSQTLQNIEIICVNDGSPDNSLEILHEYEAKDSRIVVISRENRGVGYSRNEGINRATGEFVIFMDSDDWYPSENNLEELYTKAKENNALICGGSLSASESSVPFFSEYPNVFKKEGFIEYRMYQHPYFYQRFLFDRNMLVENEIYFPNYKRFQDPPFFIRAMITAERFYAVTSVVYGYRVSHKNVNYTDEVVIDILKGIAECLELSNKYGLLELQMTIATLLPRKGHQSLPIHSNLLSSNIMLHLTFINVLTYVNDGPLGMNFVMQCLSTFSSHIDNSINLSNKSLSKENIVKLIKFRKNSFGAYKDFLLRCGIYGELQDSYEALQTKSSILSLTKQKSTEFDVNTKEKLNLQNRVLMANPLKTKADFEVALKTLIEPLEKSFDNSKYGLKFGAGAARYDDFVSEIEALIRPLWGILPFIAGGGDKKYFDEYLKKIVSGTDPTSDSYWGEVKKAEQRVVEMAALGFGLCIAKPYVWDNLSNSEQLNLFNWLNQINYIHIPKTNWLFFRILVNTGFRICEQKYHARNLAQDITDIDGLYLGDGWYCDGFNTQIDYYVPFALHFYGLIYSKVAESFDKDNAVKFKNRAKNFAKTYASYFSASGEAVPFGRSMIYRFAQAAYFSALVFADVEALPWGEIKYLLFQNLRHWFKQDIFTDNGILSLGYYYPNQIMTEGYNAFGSPYWAMKSFLALAVDENHSFWKSEEEKPNFNNRVFIPEARSIIERNDNQVQLFPLGQYVQGNYAEHSQDKYAKFVYSSYFGFSVSKGSIGLHQGAFDSTLAVSESDEYYRTRHTVESFRLHKDYLYSVWKPWTDVKIESYIIPLFPWHVRIHFVQTERNLNLADGGFAIEKTKKYRVLERTNSFTIVRDREISGIVSLLGEQQIKVIVPDPNTNLINERTLIPTAISRVQPGAYSYATAVLGAIGDQVFANVKNVPTIICEDGKYKVSHNDKTIIILDD